MRKPDDKMVGLKFGKLIVVRYSHHNKRKEQIWLCLCECGQHTKVKTYNLTSGRTKSCGCIKRGSKPVDLTGQKFHFLTVIELDDISKWREYHYKCRCDCGNTTIVSRSHLISGATKSCGCWQRDKNWTGHEEISGSYWGHTQTRARLADIEHTVTIEDAWQVFVDQDRKCALSGVTLTFCRKFNDEGKDKQTASLDRIDSSKGYTFGNVQWLHKTVNKMKLNMTDEEFVEWCRRIVKCHK